MNNWNPEQYAIFIKERTQPAIDLANKIECNKPQKILDLGCGTGNSTQVLKKRFPYAHVIGIDNSDVMLEQAKKEHPDLEFVKFDCNDDFSKLGNDFDIVFSNACIQWLPDHASLIPRMMGLLKDGGILAAQAPMQSENPVQQLIQKIAFSDKWTKLIRTQRPISTLTQSRYFDILSACSSDFNIWKTVYGYRMKSPQSIIEWYKGSGLRPYLVQLDEDNAAEFEAELLEKVKGTYTAHTNGEILFKFPRVFFTAVK